MKAAGDAVKVLHDDGDRCAMPYFSNGDINFLTFRMAPILHPAIGSVNPKEGKKQLANKKML
jgi:hypothetical protein